MEDGGELGSTGRPPIVRGPSSTFSAGSGAYPSASPSLNIEGWPSAGPGQFGALAETGGNEDSVYSKFSPSYI